MCGVNYLKNFELIKIYEHSIEQNIFSNASAHKVFTRKKATYFTASTRNKEETRWPHCSPEHQFLILFKQCWRKASKSWYFSLNLVLNSHQQLSIFDALGIKFGTISPKLQFTEWFPLLTMKAEKAYVGKRKKVSNS